jgi:hypothetical protein
MLRHPCFITELFVCLEVVLTFSSLIFCILMFALHILHFPFLKLACVLYLSILLFSPKSLIFHLYISFITCLITSPHQHVSWTLFHLFLSLYLITYISYSYRPGKTDIFLNSFICVSFWLKVRSFYATTHEVKPSIFYYWSRFHIGPCTNW